MDESVPVLEQNKNGSGLPIPKRESSEKISPKNSGNRLETIRKCLRKGSRICYTDLENITVLRRIPEKDPPEISYGNSTSKGNFEKIDSYRSGESLFKTFTFEQTRDIEDPETIKCIEFWKNVMKKNLAPIKCTLLESESIKQKTMKSSSPRRKSEERRESKESKKISNSTCDGTKIWSEALKEIRKKKLDQLKLYMRERCQYCTDPLTKELRDKMDDENAKEQQSVIISLNEWKPKNKINSTGDFSKQSSKKSFNTKIQKASASQTAETRIKDNSTTDKHELSEQPKAAIEKIDVSPQENQVPPRKHTSILKTSLKFPELSQQRDDVFPSEGFKKAAGSISSSVEVQAPNIKCPCESSTCICPHKMAVRNSRTSFVEVARKRLCQDESTEKIFSEIGETCPCADFQTRPWTNLSCFNDPCRAKQPKVQESSSSLQLDIRNLQNTDETCICSVKSKMTCPSKSCKNKMSEDTLIEGFSGVKKDKCICRTSNSEAPCSSNVCPIKVPEEIQTTKCVCGSNDPWCQEICTSWECPRRSKIKVRKLEKEEKIKFRGHPPIREITSTCMCKTHAVWNDVTCHCEICEGSSKHDSTLKTKDKSAILHKSIIKDTADGKGFNKNKGTSNGSGERLMTKQVSSVNGAGCKCVSAPPWNMVKCSKNCSVKSAEEESNKICPIESDHSILFATDDDCVCKDPNVEITCKAYKCENRETHVEYPLPCICPDNVEDANQVFRCASESCKIQKVDKTCLCRSEPESSCDAQNCIVNQPTPKILKKSEKPLNYDTKCICKVHGLPSTKEVNCVGRECPFQKKHPQLKNLTPMLLVNLPDYTPLIEENNVKCVCDNNLSSIKCHSKECEKKSKSDRKGDINTTNNYDEENCEHEICICEDKQKEFKKVQEVLCNSSRCTKKFTEDGASTQEKCVCANMDEICSEPSCQAADESKNRIGDEIMQKQEVNNYCYICGHYGCVDNRKQKKICEKVLTQKNMM